MLGETVQAVDSYFKGKCYHECRRYVEPSLWENLTSGMLNKWLSYPYHQGLSDAVTLRSISITNN